jgi:peptidase E
MFELKKKINFIACGGGDSISQILKDLSTAHSFQGKKIAYVVIAAEKDPEFLEKIHNGFGHLKEIFKSLGSKEVFLIEQENISDLKNAQIIILSGGDTCFLIEVLNRENFIQKVKEQGFCLEAIMGISAGSIALFEKGVGTKNKKEHFFNGLGLLSGTVVIHSNNELQKKYPNAIHLKDYELFRQSKRVR